MNVSQVQSQLKAFEIMIKKFVLAVFKQYGVPTCFDAHEVPCYYSYIRIKKHFISIDLL